MTKPRNLMILALGAAALAALGLASCESTPLTGTEDGDLRVSASPQTVIIDQSAGETTGTSTIAAQLFDEAGRAMIGADITFITTAGTLASGGPPNVVRTNSSGIAVDTLTLDTNDDATVTVGAISGKLSAESTITKKLSQGNVPPEAHIVFSPPQTQRIGRLVTFDGRSSEDPDSPITCYQWEIESNETERPEIRRVASFSKSFPVEQTLSVTLRVSDLSGPCDDTTVFNGLEDIQPYEIACDLTGPDALAGNDQTVQGPTVTVRLDASGSRDPDSGDTITFRWDCGNGTPIQNDPVVDCVYTNNGTTARLFTASLTVTNECGLVDDDRVNITVLAP